MTKTINGILKIMQPRLINSAKNEIVKTNKVILENINKEFLNNLQLQQWNNSTTIINWCKKIENKSKYKFMTLHKKDIYSTTRKKLLDDAINFEHQGAQIKKEDFNINQHARKSLFHNEVIPWQKKNSNRF